MLFMIAIVVCGSLFENTRLRPDGPVVPVRPGAKLFSVFGKDSIVTPIPAGDSVRLLGFTGKRTRMKYLVETGEGFRGYLKADHLPAFEEWQKLEMRENAYTHYISADKFEKESQDITLAQAQAKFGPVTQLARNGKDGFTALLNTAVFNPKNGKFARPVIDFNTDSVATAISLKELEDRNGWLLRLIPFAAQIYDFPATSWIARTDLYNSLTINKEAATPLEKSWNWVKRIIVGIFGLMWLFCTVSIPSLLVSWLLEFRKILYYVSDSGVKIISGVLTAAVSYYWMVLLMGWGAPFWIALLVIPTAIFWHQVETSCLKDEIPHYRCPQCRSLNTIVPVERDFLETEVNMEDHTKRHKEGQRTERWQEYTKVTDLRTGLSHKEDVKNHSRTTTHWRFDRYKQKVQYDRYMIHFKCNCCGYKERKRDYDRKVLSSQYVGSQHSTSVTED